MVGHSYLAGSTRLELDGHNAGLLRSVEGGEPHGEVVWTANPHGGYVDKNIGDVSYADIVMECDLVPSGPLLNWITTTLGRSSPLHSGVVVELDHADTEISRLTFTDAVIREVEFPALDVAGRQSAYLTLRVAVGSTQRQASSHAPQSKGSGAKGGTSHGPPPVSAFRLSIPGLGTSDVSEVDRLVVRQELRWATDVDGSAQLAPVSLEFPDLVVTLREANDWWAWRDAFLLHRTERTGTLEYLAKDMRQVLAQIDFKGLGIHSLVAERRDQRTDGIRRVRASMYCENLSYRPVVAASSAVAEQAAPPSQAAPLSPAPLRSRATPPSRVDVIVPLAERRALAGAGARLTL